MRNFTSILIALALSLSMGAALAQSTPTLTFEGNVMVSNSDGEFVSADNGQRVVAGQSIMVPTGGAANLTYSNGAVATFGPGTHVVPAGAVVTSSGFASSAGVTVGIVAGVVALTAAALEQTIDESDPAPPLSP